MSSGFDYRPPGECSPGSSMPDPLADIGLIVGESSAMREVAQQMRQVAASPDATVLLQGETGTGKEVFARAIHLLSRRAAYQFVDVNCAAIPETLWETELFGVEAGAFTDARSSREGYLLRADGGTLFLDEVGAMPPAVQAKLLRFLETRSFRRVGSLKEIHVQLRVISATNLDLHDATGRRAFREDLYYRLQVITLYLPPLRSRPEDIEVLACYFARLYSLEGEEPLRISAEALELLRRYPWPGNVRELRSVIQRGQILCQAHEIRPEDLPESTRQMERGDLERLREWQENIHLPSTGMNLPKFVIGIERRLVQEALELCHGNQVRAAALLGLTRDQLRYRVRDLRKDG
ncbi:MAG TPA: sigma-54 dependent transcriptional regulator [Ktedonobacteraceae bacterium]